VCAFVQAATAGCSGTPVEDHINGGMKHPLGPAQRSCRHIARALVCFVCGHAVSKWRCPPPNTHTQAAAGRHSCAQTPGGHLRACPPLSAFWKCGCAAAAALPTTGMPPAHATTRAAAARGCLQRAAGDASDTAGAVLSLRTPARCLWRCGQASLTIRPGGCLMRHAR
jgi:hypothetical protein